MISPYVVPGLKYKPQSKRTNYLEAVSKLVAEKLGVRHDRIFKKSRKRDFVEVRQISMYLLKRHYPMITLKEMGDYFGGRDHTTAIHSIQAVKDLMSTDERFKVKVIEIDDCL